MLINYIEIKRGKFFEREYGKFVIQPPHKHTNLLDIVKVIQQFNETIPPYLS